MKGCCPPPGAEVFTERVARRDAARFFVHPPAAILAVAAEHGLTLGIRERRTLWELAAIERA